MKNLKQILLIICALFAMQVHAVTVGLPAATVGFSADSTSLKVGETLEISIFAAEIEELAGGEINFGLSSLSFISVDDVQVDSHWDFEPKKGELKGSVWEKIGFDLLSNLPLKGDGLIATISLTGLKAGVTTLSLLDGSTFFSTKVELENLIGASIDITVSQVPVPAAIWFMGSGLIGLVGLRRKSL